MNGRINVWASTWAVQRFPLCRTVYIVKIMRLCTLQYVQYCRSTDRISVRSRRRLRIYRVRYGCQIKRSLAAIGLGQLEANPGSVGPSWPDVDPPNRTFRQGQLWLHDSHDGLVLDVWGAAVARDSLDSSGVVSTYGDSQHQWCVNAVHEEHHDALCGR